jgi:hypothetical protein
VDLFDIDSWVYDGETYSYDEFGAVTAPESPFWAVCTLGSDETVFVRFQVDGGRAEDNEEIISVVVEYGTTSSYGSVVTAEWCSAEGEWQAAFPASATPMYWRSKATICEVTHLGPARSLGRPKPPYLCLAPNWYCF